MAASLTTLVSILALSWAWSSWAPPPSATPTCDGAPPELINGDDRDYDYEIRCGKKTEQHSIGAKAKQKLKKKAGCALKLGDNETTRLFADMVCTIEGAKLSCDLL
ncbi:MAG: hypothetical protein JRI68_16730 [Deltaproteobacteria bacterium]|nr:hypothetical protein [Deltaproteobacteria bacterium]